ncbi:MULTISPECIES: type II toxin-antitoxin system RelE/ParE family toxin [Rhizobium]|uniref:Type II toxin-antitoxin system RelE/ParE family toxin n=1 Tax=Rhizobium rhododendri TaxID=2506430 RepID=A0ABY8ILT9_9HYPH|nr:MULTISPECIES: type II toxin-antitoxin system RelE/ParE family toxin [Rhizobium]MBZ5758145.1 type II toxin-antitoxin system RelE/ParE family toxin [Rhizobium sp. VS19-DR96]MBZ5765025.1 type II toxin-antitoxin system RelE/ParE family toxin [Rhizobium sp. VS19-DR129.2]MBZ5772568.1 type II toxin-antitoxin system RelE/ParE family toxin [Rhizobium sp. VS19-DRK62.2]MBZ5782745.1 type II toxin-antitoxin system RelE/ParE family toxin [Rhizobium sp. VS19-DR121]MBZ5800193.1 type II toxin-antitoxin syst
MFVIQRTEIFQQWIMRLKDRSAAARIASRILRAEDGNLRDVKPVGDGVEEMRIDYGPGYRIYFLRRRSVFVVLLVGGDKSTQRRDIIEAKRLCAEWKERNQ